MKGLLSIIIMYFIFMLPYKAEKNFQFSFNEFKSKQNNKNIVRQLSTNEEIKSLIEIDKDNKVNLENVASKTSMLKEDKKEYYNKFYSSMQNYINQFNAKDASNNINMIKTSSFNKENFDEHMENFDEHMENFNKHMEKFDEHMEKFKEDMEIKNENFDEHMEKFDEHMEKFKEDMEKKNENFDEHMEKFEENMKKINEKFQELDYNFINSFYEYMEKFIDYFNENIEYYIDEKYIQPISKLDEKDKDKIIGLFLLDQFLNEFQDGNLYENFKYWENCTHTITNTYSKNHTSSFLLTSSLILLGLVLVLITIIILMIYFMKRKKSKSFQLPSVNFISRKNKNFVHTEPYDYTYQEKVNPMNFFENSNNHSQSDNNSLVYSNHILNKESNLYNKTNFNRNSNSLYPNIY